MRISSGSPLRALRDALVADAREDINLALKVAVLQAQGYPRSAITTITGVEAADVQAASKRLKRAAEKLRG